MIFENICVYGGGVIGSAWAVWYLLKGRKVRLYDLTEDRLESARRSVEEKLAFFARPDTGVLDESSLEDCRGRIVYTTSVARALEGVSFVQENGPEDLAVKRSIIKTIEDESSGVIIASSTSGLLITDIAAGAKRPELIIAAHPYNPVYLMPLVEISKGERTSQETLEQVTAFYREIGKEPVVLRKESPGFIANKIQTLVCREAMELVRRGVCSVEDVDRAVTFGPGMRWGLMGPHMCIDLGSDGGFRKMMTTIFPTTKPWLEDTAKWTSTPEGYIDQGAAGLEEEYSRRDGFEGRTRDDAALFRDVGLVRLLKYHRKF